MKYIIKSILNNKFINLLLVLQIFLGMMAIYNTFDIKSKMEKEYVKFKNQFNNGNVYKLREDYSKFEVKYKVDEIINAIEYLEKILMWNILIMWSVQCICKHLMETKISYQCQML